MRPLLLVLAPVVLLAGAFTPALPYDREPASKQDKLRAEWPTRRLEYWKQIADLADSGKYQQVLAVADKVMELERELLGPDHELVADSLRRLTTIHLDAWNYPAAGRTAGEAASLFEKHFGPKDWRVGDARATVETGARVGRLDFPGRVRLFAANRAYAEGQAHHNRREYRAAAARYAVALDAYVALLGEDSRPAAEALGGLGHVYTELRDFAKADEYLSKAAAAVASVYGPLHSSAGTVENHRGILALYRGDPVGAQARFKAAFDTHLLTSGPRSDAAALCLANLAGVAAELGDYLGAIRAYTEVYETLKANHGVVNSDVATVLHKVGQCRMELGDYNLAEVAFQLGLEIRRRVDGEKSPSRVHSLNALGVLYLRIGDRRGADRALTGTTAMAREVFGPASIEYAATLNNLASLYAEFGRLDDAEAAYREALRIKTALLGEKHPDVALGLHNLASVLRLTGDVEKAEPVILKAAALAKEVFGERHPEYPTSRYSLGAFYLLKGDYRRAGVLADEAVAGHERVRGPVHPLVAEALELQAKVEAATDRPRDALATLDRAMRVQDQHLRAVFGFAPESVMQSALWKAAGTMKVMLSVVRGQLPDDTAAVEAAMTWVLRRKAGVLDSMCRQREVLLLTRDDADVRREADAVRTAFARYQRLASSTPPRGADEAGHAGAIAEARREYEEAEGRVRRAVDRARPPAVQGEVTAAAVRKKLPPGSALVEFVRAEVYDFKATGKEPVWLAPRYLALVLKPDPATPVRMIDLGDAAEIERLVRELRAAITRAPRDLRNCTEEQLDAEYRQQAAVLSNRVFAPLQPALGDARRVLLAPDADLNLLPFEALVDAKAQYLVDAYRFDYLSSGRDLLRPRAKPGAGTVVFAGPDFDWQPPADPNASPSGPPVVPVEAGAIRGVPLRAAGGLRWRPLPGAAREADDLKRAFEGTGFGPVTAFTGGDARKSTFRTLATPPRVLHVATHGFFLTPAFDDDPSAASGPVGLPPLLRSGLVLAGANRRTTSPAAPDDDGLLTAEEVGLMNLRGTELVVLSACESGLGEVYSGEGVFGLRRAFLYAGADSLMVTLFKVPDAETRELVRSFYQGVRDGKAGAAALREAKLAVIAQRRTAGGAAHPFFWASFVLIGTGG